jgi:glycosyltransferase involved in cell wall biosynthesis
MRLYAAIDKRVLKAFDRVVGVSERVAGELRRHVGPAKTVKIDNGVDLARFDGSVSADEAKKALGLGPRAVVGFVGRLAPAKGVSQLLRAVRSLGDRGIELDVLVAGEGEIKRELRSEAQALGLSERVQFLGRREDMPRIYAAMDVLVLPSFEEAFPMVVLEGMAAGVPVVSTRVGDVPYMLDEGRCGILVEPGTVAELGEAIRGLVADRARARQIASAAQRRAREHFSSRGMAGRYKEVYGQVWQDLHRAV